MREDVMKLTSGIGKTDRASRARREAAMQAAFFSLADHHPFNNYQLGVSEISYRIVEFFFPLGI
jgi:hypothetical protein